MRLFAASAKIFETGCTFRIAALVFLRFLGFIYLSAFVSLWTQLDGLIGSNGIHPAAEYLNALHRHFEGSILSQGIWQAPTLFWLGAGDVILHLGCALGCLASILLIAGILPGLSSLLLWTLYLSYTTTAGVFFGFQWDNLLLEVGFLAIFLAPFEVRLQPRSLWSPPSWTLWVYRFLLFRLMFSSGFVKVRAEGGGPNVWADLTAMNYHYETQPLPTALAWYAHQLPEWFDKASVAGTLFIQLAIPFLVFGPRLARMTAFVLLVGMQALIALTGNYCFFNLLALALCLLLVDDRFFEGRLRGWSCPVPAAVSPAPWRCRLRLATSSICGGLFLLLGAHQLTLTVLERSPGILRPAAALDRWWSPFRSTNTYGLFASMTLSRPEIEVQGSDDGEVWKTYAFRFKPGDLDRAPRWNAPHQPRLDWQMWFAALGDVRSSRNQWFLAFLVRLLEGKEEVLGLLESNPFPERPPRFVRALVADYRFTEWGSGDPNWWRKGEPRLYCPPVELDGSGRLKTQDPNF